MITELVTALAWALASPQPADLAPALIRDSARACRRDEISVPFGSRRACMARPPRRTGPAVHAVRRTGLERLSRVSAPPPPNFRTLASGVADQVIEDALKGTEPPPDPFEAMREAGYDVEVRGSGREAGKGRIGWEMDTGYDIHDPRGVTPGSMGRGFGEGLGLRQVVDACPTRAGDVAGDARLAYSLRGREPGQATEIEIVATAAVEGHVGKDARLKDYDAKVLMTLKQRSSPRDPATGQATRWTTDSYRVLYEARGLNPRASPGEFVGEIAERARNGSLGLRGWGPRGRLGWRDGEIGGMALAAGTALQLFLGDRLLEAERGWYDEMACVKLELRPSRKQLKPGGRARVTVRALRAEGRRPLGDLDGSYRATTTRGSSVRPQAQDARAKTVFAFRAPGRRWRTPPGMEVTLTSRAGRARGEHSFGEDATFPAMRVTLSGVAAYSGEEYSEGESGERFSWKDGDATINVVAVWHLTVSRDDSSAFGVARSVKVSGSWQVKGGDPAMPRTCSGDVERWDAVGNETLRLTRGGSGFEARAATVRSAGGTDDACPSPQGFGCCFEEQRDGVFGAKFYVSDRQLEDGSHTAAIAPADPFKPCSSSGGYVCADSLSWSGTVQLTPLRR